MAASGVFSSWLTESRNDRSAARAASRSAAISLNASARATASLGPAAGIGVGRSPAARLRAASATRRIGRAIARARKAAAAAAIPEADQPGGEQAEAERPPGGGLELGGAEQDDGVPAGGPGGVEEPRPVDRDRAVGGPAGAKRGAALRRQQERGLVE